MGPITKQKTRFDFDDFVRTISDDESDVPDLDFENEIQTTPESTSNGLKRKRVADDTKPDSKTKKKKKQKDSKKQKEASVEPEEEEEHGVDDGAIDPDFEFIVGKDIGGIVEGFGDWAVVTNRNGGQTTSTNHALGIDEIVARRRKQDNGVPSTPGAPDHGHDPDVDGFPGFDDGDDELLADDAFGMGAVEEDEDENGDAHNEESGSVSGEDSEKDSADEESDEDDNSIAAPVPHPDDAIYLDGADEDEEEDEDEVAKRAAFYAPEDKAGENDPLTTTSTSFQTMSLSRPILKGLASVGFSSATPIQVKAIPVALLGKDVVGGAVTGSGKTGAFVIPILERLLYRPKKVPTTRVAILMPTRELAAQCYNVATKLAAFTDISFALVVGGLSLREQEQTLKKRPDVVIATPGRFIDHMRNSASFAVENLEILVLDEADRMLEDGFEAELTEIIETIPKSRQTMLFSATMTENVDKLIRVGLNRPVRLMVDAKKQTVEGLVQEFIKMKGTTEEIDEDRRLAYLLYLCSNTYTEKTIVFFPRKALAHRVKVLFSLHGLKAAELHGSMSQEQRLAAITSFRDNQCTHLLATDLASRGLDIPRVETVINFTVPTTTTTYLHRVGRTARAGRTGVACTLFSAAKGKSSGKSKQASERTLLRPILRVARGQTAKIRTRTLPPDAINDQTQKIEGLQEEIDAILLEEKEERLLQQTERDVTKGENLVRYEDEIASRPRRTWFQGEKDKQAASQLGKKERLGVEAGTQVSKEKKKLSGKDKKRLMDRDERVGGSAKQGWKKGREERSGKGVLAKKKDEKKNKKVDDSKVKKKPAKKPNRHFQKGGKGKR